MTEVLLAHIKPILAVGAASVAILASAEIVRRIAGPAAEWTRKLVHVLMGLLAATFPWLFSSPWPVALLCGGFAILLGLTQFLGLMRSVHGVDRTSGGVIYYPIAVALLFFLTEGIPGFYLACILVMALCDAAAALIGGAYGRFKFRVQGDVKSVEGSAMFLLTAFACVHVPLLLLTGIGRAECVLISLYVAILVTLFEALSIRGIDNLIVPYGAYFILARAHDETAIEIGKQILILLAVAAVISLLARLPKSLMGGAVLAVILMAYGAWALADFAWFLGVALVVGWFCLFWAVPKRAWMIPAEFELRDVFHVFLLPFLILWAANAWRLYEALFLPFLAALATAFALILHAWLGLSLPRRVAAMRWTRAACSILVATAAVVLPAAAAHGSLHPFRVAWAGGTVLAATVVYVGVFERRMADLPAFLRILVLLEAFAAALLFRWQELAS